MSLNVCALENRPIQSVILQKIKSDLNLLHFHLIRIMCDYTNPGSFPDLTSDNLIKRLLSLWGLTGSSVRLKVSRVWTPTPCWLQHWTETTWGRLPLALWFYFFSIEVIKCHKANSVSCWIQSALSWPISI